MSSIPASLQRLPGSPPDIREMNPRDALAAIYDYLKKLEDFTTGPAPSHASAHLTTGLDPLGTAAPVDLGDELAEGDGPTFARSNHVHRLRVRVAKDGAVIGTRKRLNFLGDVSVTDDEPGDEIDVELLAASIDSIRAFLPHPQPGPKVQAGTNITITENALGPVIAAAGAGSAASDDADSIIASQVFGG